MSEIGLGFEPDDAPRTPDRAQPGSRARRSGGSRRAEVSGGRRARGCLPLLIVLVVVVAGAWFGGGKALDKVKELAGSDPDYAGPGKGSVIVEVHEGDSSTAIGQALEKAGVVKSVGAFTSAAMADERALSIQVGYYQLKKEMKAKDALAILVDPANLIQASVTIPEGYQVKDIVTAIVKKTDFTAAQVRAALKDTAGIGLPAEAGGKVEGYLFPATYTVVPGETAKQLLRQMVTKTKQVEQALDLKTKAQALGFTAEEIFTVASIIEHEGNRSKDYPKIARAIYNRLDQGMALQSDATVNYANGKSGSVFTTDADRANQSPYNTYVHTGLPPGPIGSPGEATLRAALDPADGDWLYWITVNLKTGETRFNTSYEGHLADREVLRQYCQTSDAC